MLLSLTKRYIFQFTKYQHKGVAKSIDFDERNFSSVKPQQNFQYFLHQNILFQECSKKDQTYIPDILTLFEYILTKSKFKKWESEDDPIFSWISLIL